MLTAFRKYLPSLSLSELHSRCPVSIHGPVSLMLYWYANFLRKTAGLHTQKHNVCRS
jgi:hypothetical protein